MTGQARDEEEVFLSCDTIIAFGKTEVCDLTTPNADGAVIAL